MIYEIPLESEPIKQGDIFYPIPQVIIDLEKINAFNISSGQIKSKTWGEVEETDSLIVPIEKVWGIVGSQNCDILTANNLTLFLIGQFSEISKQNPQSVKKWVSMITQHSRMNAGWFYLPSDDNIGFIERMAVDFEVAIQISKDTLDKKRNLRKGCLNKVATEHFREKIAQYYKRYPYDEWYPLNKEEFNCYNKDKGPVRPFPGQEDNSQSST